MMTGTLLPVTIPAALTSAISLLEPGHLTGVEAFSQLLQLACPRDNSPGHVLIGSGHWPNLYLTLNVFFYRVLTCHTIFIFLCAGSDL